MGNSPRSSLQQQRQSLTPLPIDPYFDSLSQWKNAKGDILLTREIQLPQSISLTRLRNKLENRENLSNRTSLIYPLGDCYFENMASMCSQQQRCTLTCIKPKNNLQKVFEERKLTGKRFSSEEINLVINNISKAFQALLELDQSFCNLRMNHIVLSNNIYLMDPVLIESDPFGYNMMAEYPAPEQLVENKQLLSLQSITLMRLFSLGMIGLQLYHSPISVKQVYEKNQKYGIIVNINTYKLNELIANISDVYLKSKLATILSFNPQNRKNIFNFIQNEKTTIQNISMIVKKLDADKPIHQLNAPLSPILHSSQVRQKSALKQMKNQQNLTLSPINKHPHLQKHPTTEQSQVQKPKVSINFVSKIHNISIQPNQASTPTAKKSLAMNNVSKRQQENQPPQQKKECITEQTPLRTKKKRNFSTIKEVSEYDQCTSTSRVFIVQDISVNGKYEGQLVSGNRQGWGIFYFQQGCIYEGQWKDDQMHGYGKLYYPSGKLAYEGQWKNNQFSGIGKVFNDNPHYLEGSFDFTDFNQLAEEWVYYEGNLEQDQRQGKGLLALSNGEVLYGQFLADKIHGSGQFRTLSGKVIHGIWKDSFLERTFAQ